MQYWNGNFQFERMFFFIVAMFLLLVWVKAINDKVVLQWFTADNVPIDHI